ncbi:hypothetical protein B0H13DRAFT_2666961 [Mycena leptocephala]|nr:hypothetical protein B0H13DRAFT_2666961 [Mycena leptocephala]
MPAANLAGCIFPIGRLIPRWIPQHSAPSGQRRDTFHLVRVWRSGARRWRWYYFGGYHGGGAMSRFARGLFAAQNIRPRGAGPSGSPTPPAHAKSPFSFDDPCSTQPTRHPRSVRSSMTSISTLSPRPARHRAFNVPVGPAAPVRALPFDFANVPPRVACES